ncbi:MAG: ABC transporter ATP-binding protein, partial [Anaerolineae bacterium]|nr:ABC transporter ATP-binding protein [Anaerolineae bacterium]
MAENRSDNHTGSGTRSPRGSTRPGAGERTSGGPRRGPGGRGRFGPVQKAEDVRGTMFRLAGYLLRYKKALVLTVILVALASGLGVLGPFLMGRAIDNYIIKGDLAGLVGILGLMVAVNVVGSGVRWVQTIVMISASQQTVRDLRNDLFSKLQTLSLRYFDQHTHGELMSRLTNDVDNVSMVLTNTVTQLVSSALSVTGIAAMMFVLNWRLALVTLITIPLMLFLTQLVAKRTRKGFRDQQKYLGD